MFQSETVFGISYWHSICRKKGVALLNHFFKPLGVVWMLLAAMLVQNFVLSVPAYGSTGQCQVAFAEDKSYVAELQIAMDLQSTIKRARTIGVDPTPAFVRTLKLFSLNDGAIDGRNYNRLENSGALNHGVFRITGQSSSTILKILMIHPDNGYVEQVRGAHIGAALGGPLVHDVGLIRDPADGTLRVSIEMEELFPGRTRFTMKDNFRTEHLLIKTSDQLTIAAAIVEMMFDAASRNILVRDPDVMFTSEGLVRWIDTNAFSFSETSLEAHQRIVFETTSLLFQTRSRPLLNQIFLEAYLQNLRKNRDLNALDKVDLLKSLEKQTSRLGLSHRALTEELLKYSETTSSDSVRSEGSDVIAPPSKPLSSSRNLCRRFPILDACQTLLKQTKRKWQASRTEQ